MIPIFQSIEYIPYKVSTHDNKEEKKWKKVIDIE